MELYLCKTAILKLHRLFFRKLHLYASDLLIPINFIDCKLNYIKELHINLQSF